jgi:hypothetical protein
LETSVPILNIKLRLKYKARLRGCIYFSNPPPPAKNLKAERQEERKVKKTKEKGEN